MASDWEEVNLGDLFEQSNQGVNTTTEKVEYSDDGLIVIRAKNISAYAIDYQDVVNVSEETFDKLKSAVKPKYGDILFTNIGSQLGSAALVKNNSNFIIAWNVFRIVPNLCKVNAKFLESFLNSEETGNLVRGLNASSTMPFISGKVLRSIKLNLPTLPEQKAIAHILGSLDDKIELNRQMNETLEAMAQALFKSWFVDFDPVIDNALAAGNSIPDEFSERAEQRKGIEKKDNSDIQGLFPNEFEFTEEMGWIPKGWEIDSVENIIEINPKITLKKGTLAPYADMKALPEYGYSIDGVIQKAYAGGTKFENRDVLFARITPCLENGKTGLVDFLKPNEVGFGSTEFIVLREKDDIKMEFIACLARNSKFRLHAQQSMVGSSGRQRVQNACFSSFYLALPKDGGKVLNLFNKVTAINFDKIFILANECQTLAKLRDTLLPKLMSGELRIADAIALVDEAV